jgi:predicted secreted protein
MKIKVAFIALFFLCAGLLSAGDIAQFVNLGFSDDNRFFMFAQYGVQETTSFPYADLFVVDVPANKFVPQGVKHGVYSEPSEPGYNGEGALFNLLGDNLSLKAKYGIRHLNTGRLLYLLIDGDKPKSELDFRDFVSGKQYRVRLVQSARGSGKATRSSFFIEMTIISTSGTMSDYTVGLPNYERKEVKSYRIRQILLAPDGRSMIFVVEKEEVDTSGSNFRYMIETVRIR